MLNIKKYTAMAVLGVGLAVAAAAPANAQWFGWGGPFGFARPAFGFARPAFGFARPAFAYAPIRHFGFGCVCPHAYGAAYFPRFRIHRPYAYAGYSPRFRIYRPYAYAGYLPRFRI